MKNPNRGIDQRDDYQVHLYPLTMANDHYAYYPPIHTDRHAVEVKMENPKTLNYLKNSVDNGFKELLVYTGRAVTYTYLMKDGWKKDGDEGPLFIVSHIDGNHYIGILNNSSQLKQARFAKEKVEDIDKIETGDRFIMLSMKKRNLQNEQKYVTKGIWFVNENHFKDALARLQELIPSRLGKVHSASSTSNGEEAASEYDEDEGKPLEAVTAMVDSIALDNGALDADTLILNKTEFQEMLIKLIKSDKFINHLHDEYLKNRQKKQQPQTQPHPSQPPALQYPLQPMPPLNAPGYPMPPASYPPGYPSQQNHPYFPYPMSQPPFSPYHQQHQQQPMAPYQQSAMPTPHQVQGPPNNSGLMQRSYSQT